ncbi:hypothetical protein CO612_09145 [Lysobacteraceae bacterium NML71-0210]|nr:hypothetical protein CO612_09145 [Xanthomonadaceae bacterium NML71-0210]
MALRKDGLTFAEIAEALAYNSPQAAHDAVKRALDRVVREPALDLLALESERLDGLWKATYPAAKEGDTKAIAACLRIMERRAKLLGLDAPERVEAKVTARELPASVEEFV